MHCKCTLTAAVASHLGDVPPHRKQVQQQHAESILPFQEPPYQWRTDGMRQQTDQHRSIKGCVVCSRQECKTRGAGWSKGENLQIVLHGKHSQDLHGTGLLDKT